DCWLEDDRGSLLRRLFENNVGAVTRTSRRELLCRTHEEVRRAAVLLVHLDDEGDGQRGDVTRRRSPHPALPLGGLQDQSAVGGARRRLGENNDRRENEEWEDVEEPHRTSFSSFGQRDENSCHIVPS